MVSPLVWTSNVMDDLPSNIRTFLMLSFNEFSFRNCYPQVDKMLTFSRTGRRKFNSKLVLECKREAC